MPTAFLYNILFRPTIFFSRLNNYPRWVYPYILICATTIVVALLNLPFSQHVIVATLKKTMNYDSAVFSAENTKNLRLIGIYLVPIERGVRWVVYALAVYCCTLLINSRETTFKKTFGVVVSAETVFAIMSVLNTLILHYKGLSSITDAIDLNVIVGLDVFLIDKYSNKLLYTLLSNINIFSVWHIVLMSIGISITASIKKIDAYIIISSFWVFNTCVEIFMVALTQRLLNNGGAL